MKYYNFRKTNSEHITQEEYDKLSDKDKENYKPYKESKVNFVTTSKFHEINEHKPKENIKLAASRYE